MFEITATLSSALDRNSSDVQPLDVDVLPVDVMDQGMPGWARAIGDALPLTHFVRATRGVVLKGAGASLVVSEMLPIAVFTLIASAAALAAYRRRID